MPGIGAGTGNRDDALQLCYYFYICKKSELFNIFFKQFIRRFSEPLFQRMIAGNI